MERKAIPVVLINLKPVSLKFGSEFKETTKSPTSPPIRQNPHKISVMATNGVEIVDVPDNALDDDGEVYVLYSTPPQSGTSKLNAIPVDIYRPKPRSDKQKQVVIDLSHYDDETPNKPLIFTCEICVEEKPFRNAFGVLGCNHSYCTECVAKYVGSKLQENITKINCPVSDCKGYFEPHQCRFILPKQVFDRWGDALCEALILGTEKFYCPYKDCSALLINDGNEAVVQSECPSCYRLFCAGCKAPWHVGICCGEFQKLNKDERGKEDIMLMNLAKNQKWMRCPKCKVFVSRIDGCLFIRCRCGHNFCYHCGSTIAGINHYCSNCKR